VSDEVKSIEYCNQLDAYLDDEDVQYAMFWYCIDNHKPKWNELQELKKLPMSETKKNMVQQSLDTGTLFLKSFVNDKEINELQRVESIKKLCVRKWNKFTKLCYSHYVGDVTEWDASFYKDIKDKRRECRDVGKTYKLSKKQKHHIDRVEEIANHSVRNLSDTTKTAFINHAIEIGF
jgi:hypothetical protein